jgi:hypothetical protein
VASQGDKMMLWQSKGLEIAALQGWQKVAHERRFGPPALTSAVEGEAEVLLLDLTSTVRECFRPAMSNEQFTCAMCVWKAD